jgi:hypothetical protein
MNKKLTLEVVLGLLVLAGLLYWLKFRSAPAPDVSNKISEQTKVETKVPTTNPFTTTNPIPTYANPFK